MPEGIGIEQHEPKSYHHLHAHSKEAWKLCLESKSEEWEWNLEYSENTSNGKKISDWRIVGFRLRWSRTKTTSTKHKRLDTHPPNWIHYSMTVGESRWSSTFNDDELWKIPNRKSHSNWNWERIEWDREKKRKYSSR